MENEIKYYPLTHPQKAIWYTEKMYPGTSIGNVAASLRLMGQVDYTLLEKAINIFIERNDAVRLKMVEIDGEPKQYVSEYTYHKLDFYDFSGKDITELYKWDEEQTKIPFKAIESELFYFALIKVNDTDGGFYVKFHHFISDAWTMSLLGNQVVECYSDLKNGQDILKEMKPSYIDYIQSEEEYRKSKRFEKDKEYWKSKFEVWNEATTIKTRKSNNFSTKARRKAMLIPKKLTAKMHEYCQEKVVSEFTLFCAALSMYINRVTAKEDLTLGTTLLNRSNSAEKDTAGMFASVAVPMRIHVKDDMNLNSFVEIISKETLSVFRHQKYPYDLLLKDIREKNKVSSSLFDIVLTYQNSKFNKTEQAEEYITRWHFNGHQVESLIINISDREDEGRLIIDYDYLIDLFHATEIEFIHQHIINLLWHALDNPEKVIAKLHMLSEKERHKILCEFNNTKAEYQNEKLIHQIFEEQVEVVPDNIAVAFEDKQLTYRELNEKANKLARVLREKGVHQDTIVPVMTYRSLEMIIGILGILKAGGCYLPIDPNYPQDRIKYMLEDSDAKLILIQSTLREKVKFDIEIIDLDNKELYFGDGSNLEYINKPNDLAYIIYTSGSTGRPKGVMLEHTGLVNRINWMQKKYPMNQNSVILQKTPYTFDVSVWEMFWWSFVGARVCFLKPGGEKDPQEIIDAVEKYKVTTMHFVPSMLSMFLQYIDGHISVNKLSSLKQVFASGEALNVQQVNKFNKLLYEANHTELYNLYGPTEATIDVSYFDCSPEVNLNSIPIGKPIDNIKLYILDKSSNLQPVGIPGELCIGGIGVARGYLNKPELTDEKFIPNPFDEGDRLYKTGDLARWYPKGDIEYLGRLDHQIKIRGFRIELGEIETKLLEHKNIKDAIVIGKSDNNIGNYLCAYCVSEVEIPISELRTHLSKTLPDYMVPAYFVMLDKLPINSNGKADRKALPEPNLSAITKAEYVLPSNEIEEKLVKTWSDVLVINQIGIFDNFFSLGGDSLSIIDILTRLYKYNWGLTIADFYKYQTISELSKKVLGIYNAEQKTEPIDIVTIYPKEEIKNISKRKIELKDVLLTGATGFLGMHILRELIENSKANIYCLVRGEDTIEAENRVLQLLNFYFEDKYGDLIGTRIFTLIGDVTLDRFGLSDKQYGELGKTIETVIHAAALVKYFGDYSEFEKVNVFGTKRIIDFTLKYGIKLNYISTISVAGNNLVANQNLNKSNFNENDFYIGQSYTENVYVRSKFEAENLIFKAMKQGLDATIFRIGNLTGRYLDGHFQKNINENAFYSAIKSIIELGAVSNELLQEDIEFTSVDFASKAIIMILKTIESSGRVFHILNHQEVKVKNIIEMLRKIGVEVDILDKEKFKKYISNKINDESRLNQLSGSLIYLNELGELAYANSVNIDSSISQRYLTKLGFKWPKVKEKYLDMLINHMKSVKYIS